MNWQYLLVAIILDVAGTASLKFSNGFTKILPSMGVVVCYLLCFFFLGTALKKWDTGVLYAIWSGLGTVLMVVIGVLFFKEQIDIMKIACILLILIGVIGLNLANT